MITTTAKPRTFWRQVATPQEAADTEPVLLTVKEAVEMLRVSHWTVYELIRTGKLATIKIGRRRLVPVEAVHTLIANMRSEGTL